MAEIGHTAQNYANLPGALGLPLLCTWRLAVLGADLYE